MKGLENKICRGGIEDESSKGVFLRRTGLYGNPAAILGNVGDPARGRAWKLLGRSQTDFRILAFFGSWKTKVQLGMGTLGA